MAVESVARSGHSSTVPVETKNRAIRGVRLANERGHEVRALGGQRYAVPGCSGGEYVVQLDLTGEFVSCTCPDHQRRGTICKHGYCLFTVRARRRAACASRFVSGAPTDELPDLDSVALA